MTLTESDVSAIVAALRVAAVQYMTDAQTSGGFSSRVFAQFKAQSVKANTLADKLEEAETLTLVS